MKIPKISVILPVYNCEKYIAEAVESILNQTFSDFELLIIDDASTDSTPEILRKYDDPRINIVFKKINQGVSSAINDGLRSAKGNYIARMDADDVSLPNRFEKQFSILENNPSIMLCSNWIQFFGESDRIFSYKEWHDEIVSELLIYCAVCMCSSMFRRQELSQCFFDENKKSGEDYDFLTRIVSKGQIYNIQEVLLMYRTHPEQASKAHKMQQITDDVEIRLNLFKNINYDRLKYPDAFLQKIFLMNNTLLVSELDLFLKWQKELINLNKEQKIFSDKTFRSALKRINRVLVFEIYFKSGTQMNIDKKWRFRALWKLSAADILYVMNFKIRENRKMIFKR